MRRPRFLVMSPRQRCPACERGDHDNCEPIPLEETGFAAALDGSAFVECDCLCFPAWLRGTLDTQPASGERRYRPRLCVVTTEE